jgi:hypothetical protein
MHKIKLMVNKLNRFYLGARQIKPHREILGDLLWRSSRVADFVCSVDSAQVYRVRGVIDTDAWIE